MKVFLILVSVQLVIAAASDDFELPSAFKICKLNDPSRNECIKEAIQYLLASPSNSESVGLPRLDPFTYDKATLNFDGSRLLNGTLTVKDIKVLGLRKEKVLSVKSAFNKGNMVVEAELFIPKVFGTGRYKADVSLNALKFNSRGQFNATLTEVNTKCVIKGKLNTINGVDYMKLYKFSILPDVKGMKISVSGLFPDENLNNFANNYINQNWQTLYKQSLSESKQYWEPILLDMINKFFARYPFEKLMIAN